MAGIDQLIINSAFHEPTHHWKYDLNGQTFVKEPGRRPAGYFIAGQGSNQYNDIGQFIELPLVNKIRPRVKAWRQAGYPGVTGVTQKLLDHWNDKDARQYQFFFCQMDAIETIIWLTEAPEADKVGIEIPGDGGLFRRICTKLCTGGGKTTVMAMLIAWMVCNKATYYLHLPVHETDPADVLPDIAAHVGDSFGCVVVVPCYWAGSGQGFAAPAAVLVCSAGFLRVAVALSGVSVSAGEGAVLAALVCQCGPLVISQKVPAGPLGLAEPDRLVMVDVDSGLLVGHGVGHAPDQRVGVLADRVLLHGLASDFCRESQLVRCENHHNVRDPPAIENNLVSHVFAPFAFCWRSCCQRL